MLKGVCSLDYAAQSETKQEIDLIYYTERYEKQVRQLVIKNSEVRVPLIKNIEKIAIIKPRRDHEFQDRYST
jgi:hypothetical protein